MHHPVAIAIAAHPDDIEFQMAGTLLLLKEAGWETHYFNLSSGNGGSVKMDSGQTAAVRLEEAKEAAAILGAQWHPPIANDLEIFYNETLLRKTAAVIREVQPSIVLTQPVMDYMEDHMNTARLAVTAAFAHGVPNFKSDPPREAYYHDVTLYHCMPHGGRDPLRRPVIPGSWVDVSAVNEVAMQALAAHRSQQAWLETSQGMNHFLAARQESLQEMGRLSGVYRLAEGWHRHLHLGFSATDTDPLVDVLKERYLINEAFASILSPPMGGL